LDEPQGERHPGKAGEYAACLSPALTQQDYPDLLTKNEDDHAHWDDDCSEQAR
jgi:hypothetical protein